MNPTPSKLVLLMSAAGLGLTWSGVALASRSDAPAGFALTFGAAPSNEPGCSAQVPEAWASCPGQLVKAIVAETAHLPLPLAIVVADTEVPLRAAEVSAGVRASDGAPKLSDEAALPATSTPVLSTDDGSGSSRAAAALQHDPRQSEDDPAAAVEPNAASPAPTPSAAAQAPKSAVFASVRRDDAGQAATSHGSALVDWASVDRVFATLEEVLGTQFDEPRVAAEATHQQATGPKHEGAVRALASPAALGPAQAVAVSPIEAPRSGDQLRRWNEADEIVVATSHSDKVLMSLAALRSGDAAQMRLWDAPTKKSAVVRHTDKVLETLALFRTKESQRTTWACTGDSDDEAWGAVSPAIGGGSEVPEAAGESAIAGAGDEVDIVLDLLPPDVDQAEKRAPHSAPAAAERVEQSTAGAGMRSALGSELVALSTDKLEDVRGGFVTEGGLKISFGIERAVFLNGTLVTTTSLNIADLAKISGGQAQVTSSGLANSLGLVQSGARNIFAPGSISSTAAGTVIQNTLDNQKINTITRIDAVVNSAGIMRSINLQSSMRSAIVDSLRR